MPDMMNTVLGNIPTRTPEDIAKGNDPKTGKRINTQSDITLREVFQKFLEIKLMSLHTHTDKYPYEHITYTYIHMAIGD